MSAGRFVHRGLHHDDAAGGLHEDRLAVDALECERALVHGKQPELVAVAEIRRGLPWRKLRRLPVRIGRIEQILARHDLLVAHAPALRDQPAGVEAAAPETESPAEIAEAAAEVIAEAASEEKPKAAKKPSKKAAAKVAEEEPAVEVAEETAEVTAEVPAE